MATVAIVCALESELDQVKRALGQASWSRLSLPGDPQQYWNSSLTFSGHPVRLVAATPSHMGLTPSAVLTTKMVLAHSPVLVVMVGIAAGARAAGGNPGDILIAQQVVDYRSGKVSLDPDGNEVFTPDPHPISISPRLHSLLKSTHVELCRGIREDWPGNKPPTALQVHVGTSAAGDQVVDSPKTVAKIRQHWRKLIGFEMESYALYLACSQAKDPAPLFVSFKSICDFGDGTKEDSWQAYAAYTAASYLKNFLDRHLVELLDMEVRALPQ